MSISGASDCLTRRAAPLFNRKKETNLAKKPALLLFLALTPALAWGDTLPISCVAPTSCTNSSVTQITKGTQPTFDRLNRGQPRSGEGYMAVLLPGSSVTAPPIQDGTLDLTITFSKEKLGDPGNLNEPERNAYRVDSIIGASEQFGSQPGSFTAHKFDLGNYSSAGKGKPRIYVHLAGLTKGGDVLSRRATPRRMRWNGPLCQRVSSWMAAASAVFPPPRPIPEPTALLLFGTALLAVGASIRRHARKR